MSSPMRKTDSSRRISSAIASRSASPTVNLRMEHRVGRGAGELDGVLDRRVDLGLDRVRVGDLRAQPDDRVARSPVRLLLPRAVAARVRAAVADEAVRL